MQSGPVRTRKGARSHAWSRGFHVAAPAPAWSAAGSVRPASMTRSARTIRRRFATHRVEGRPASPRSLESTSTIAGEGSPCHDARASRGTDMRREVGVKMPGRSPSPLAVLVVVALAFGPARGASRRGVARQRHRFDDWQRPAAGHGLPAGQSRAGDPPPPQRGELRGDQGGRRGRARRRDLRTAAPPRGAGARPPRPRLRPDRPGLRGGPRREGRQHDRQSSWRASTAASRRPGRTAGGSGWSCDLAPTSTRAWSGPSRRSSTPPSSWPCRVTGCSWRRPTRTATRRWPARRARSAPPR